MIVIKSKGSFKKTEDFLNEMKTKKRFKILDKYGLIGVSALEAATPVDTGETAKSWTYEVLEGKETYSIAWYNSSENKGLNIALLIQYGHATNGGSWVEGYDYINPAIQPLFDQIANDVWEEVKNA